MKKIKKATKKTFDYILFQNCLIFVSIYTESAILAHRFKKFLSITFLADTKAILFSLFLYIFSKKTILEYPCLHLKN